MELFRERCSGNGCTYLMRFEVYATTREHMLLLCAVVALLYMVVERWHSREGSIAMRTGEQRQP